MASSSSSNFNAGKILKRANPSTIQDKFLVGYQGWFTCPGDGEPVGSGHHGWLHWFNYPIPDGGRPNTDVWPDVSSYSPSELFPAPGLKTKAGEAVFLFSSRNAKTVQRHFHWMAEHGVDGAFLQRFAGQCDLEAGNEGIMRIRDEVGDRVREAAEREGRVFAIMYDVSGVPPDRIQKILERDWAHLVRNKDVLDSPNYLREKGKPVVALWGFGFDNAQHTPELVHSITQFFRNTTPGGVYIMGGTPASWRTAEGDADRNPAFLDVWLNDFDAISPWTVGRYSTDQDVDGFFEGKMKGDFDLIKRNNEEGSGRKIDYIPVVLPGGSGYNLSEGKWGFNDIKRHGGRFLWKQIFNAKRLGVRTIYGAMWDEYDEGTAFMPIVEHKQNLPESDKFRFMALDEDGYDVPSDWYMRICGFAAEGLRSERRIHDTFPVKELQDYWSSRPKYEAVSQKSTDFVSGLSNAIAGGSGAGGSGVGSDADGQTYEEWLAVQKEGKEEAPPPPYSLEADEESASTPAVQTRPVAVLATAASVAPVSPPTIVSQTALTMMTNAPQPPAQIHMEGPPVVNPSTYPSSSYAGPGPSSSGPGGIQHQTQDPITNLAHDFGRQSISNPSGVETSNSMVSNSHGRVPIGSPPPLHPAHPATQNPAQGASSGYAGLQSRPSNQGRPRPSSQARPGSQQHSRPQSQQGYHSGPSVAVTPSPAQQVPTSGTWSQGQWPPPEWNKPSPSAPSVTQSTYPRPPGGANLSRPHTFSASADTGSGGASLRPSATVSGRPSSALSNQITPPVNYLSSPISDQHSPSSYPAPSTHISPNSFSSAHYPQHNASPYAPGSSTAGPPSHGHGHGHSALQFQSPSPPSTYPPPMSGYPGQAGSTFPGQPSGSAYQPLPGSSYTPWSDAPPHISPPHSPLGVAPSTFPGQSAYPSRPHNPGQGSVHQQQYSDPSYSGSTSPMGRPEGGGLYFPQGPGGEESHFAGGGSDSKINMPASSSTAYGPSYSGQYVMSPSSYPGGPSYPQPDAPAPGPWMAPPIPPNRPSNSTQSGSSYGQPSGPSFPMASTGGSSALGFAWNAVDKFAGKKTREQLESQVGNLAHTSNKLFNKYLK